MIKLLTYTFASLSPPPSPHATAFSCHRLIPRCAAVSPPPFILPPPPLPQPPLHPYHRPHLLLRRPRHLRHRFFCHHISSASSFHEKRIKEIRSVRIEEVTKKAKSSTAVVCASAAASSTAPFPAATAFPPTPLCSPLLPHTLLTNERIKQ